MSFCRVISKKLPCDDNNFVEFALSELSVSLSFISFFKSALELEFIVSSSHVLCLSEIAVDTLDIEDLSSSRIIASFSPGMLIKLSVSDLILGMS